MKGKFLVALLIFALSTTLAFADSKKSVKKASPVETESNVGAIYEQISTVSKLIASQTYSGEDPVWTLKKGDAYTETYAFYADPASGEAEYRVIRNRVMVNRIEGEIIEKNKFNLKFIQNKIINSDFPVQAGGINRIYNTVIINCKNDYKCVARNYSNDDDLHRMDLGIIVSNDTRNEIANQLVKLISMFKEKQ